MKIGFIGLGIMGKPMALNLIKAGHQLVVFDIIKEAMSDAVTAGAEAASSPKEVAKSCRTIITMLPDSPDVKIAVLGENGVLEGAEKDSLLIDMSSIAPGAAQEIAAECWKAGVVMLDAPVSGGEPKAIDGTLSIMVGGSEAIFEFVKEDILLKMGASAVYCGEIGAGNTTKLANQVIVACNIAALAEALTLARKAGVDPARVYDAIKGGLAGSTVMNAKAPMMLAGQFMPGFRIDLHIKDLKNALETGSDIDAPLPLSAAVMEMFRDLRADGCGKDDHSALAKYYAKISGVRIDQESL